MFLVVTLVLLLLQKLSKEQIVDACALTSSFPEERMHVVYLKCLSSRTWLAQCTELPALGLTHVVISRVVGSAGNLKILSLCPFA